MNSSTDGSPLTVVHGAMLSFETVAATDAASAPARLREQHQTLMRVVDGTVTLEVGGTRRVLGLEGEARIEASVPHRLWNAGAAEAQIVQEFRRAS